MDAATSVEISVYYESLCPDSIWYVCTKTFVFRPLTLAQSRSQSRREDFSSVRDPARSLSRPIHTPPQQPTPPKISGIVCSSGDFGTLAAHVATIWWIWWGWRGHPTPYPQPPPHPPNPPPPTCPPPPISWCVVCLCVVHAQCCQVPKKFPASTSKKFGQFRKKLGKFPKTSISQCLVY